MLRTCVFRTEGRVTPPVHPPTRTAPSTGRGTLERAAVLLTSPRVPFLLLSALGAGTGAPAPSAASLPPPLPLPPSLLLPPRLPERMTRIAATARAEIMVTASASISRSVNTAPAMLLLALGVSLLAPSPAWSVVTTSVLIPLSTSITVVVAPPSVRGRTATPSPASGTLDASRALAKVSNFFLPLVTGASDVL